MKCQEYRTLFEIQNISGMDSIISLFLDRINRILVIFLLSFLKKLRKSNRLRRKLKANFAAKSTIENQSPDGNSI